MNARTPAARRPSPSVDANRAPGHGTVVQSALVIVAALAFAAAGVVVAASGLVAPDWARWVFVAVWLLGLERLVAWRRRPWLTLAVPTAMWLFLVGSIVVGELWLGWTA